MWPYWFMLLLVSLGSISTPYLRPIQQKAIWLSVIVILIVIVGLRHEVGGDWNSYFMHLQRIGGMSFSDSLAYKDPGYYGLNWLVKEFGGGIYAVNLICAILTLWGVSAFSMSQPRPWLALIVAVPYLLMVVAMGYTRQSAALGLALLGITALGRGNQSKFVMWVLAGALFHKSAVLLLPIAALSATKRRIWTMLWVGVVSFLGAYFLVLDSAGSLWVNYVEADYHSSGALTRVLMNAVPAMIVLLCRRYLFYDIVEYKLWFWMSVFSLIMVPLVMVSSTAVDRLALYFIPLQLIVFSRLPGIARSIRARTVIQVGIVIYYAAVQFVWLNFASHAFAWLPYRNILFIERM